MENKIIWIPIILLVISFIFSHFGSVSRCNDAYYDNYYLYGDKIAGNMHSGCVQATLPLIYVSIGFGMVASIMMIGGFIICVGYGIYLGYKAFIKWWLLPFEIGDYHREIKVGEDAWVPQKKVLWFWITIPDVIFDTKTLKKLYQDLAKCRE